MSIEINLWVNGPRRYNGNVNINRGESITRFPRLITHSEFIIELVRAGTFTPEEAANSDFDSDSLYALLPRCHFVQWKINDKHIQYFNGTELITIPENRSYRSSVNRNAPAITFRL